jgi:hypothetical protein
VYAVHILSAFCKGDEIFHGKNGGGLGC